MNVEKLEGMQISEADLEKAVCEPSSKASDSFNISWLGEASSTNAAVVETTYSGGNLLISVVVTGTPTAGVTCVITAVPLNCKLKSGDSKETIAIYGSNLGYTFFGNITPTDDYIGSTVQFSVSISGVQGAVLYAKGNIGK